MISREIKVGDRLRWTDPHDTTTTLFTVDKIEGQRVFCKNGSYFFIGESRRGEFEHVDEPQADMVNHSGSKYLREVQLIGGKIDVYAVLVAFDVRCPARQHAIKKLLCAGLRGKGDELQDLHEAGDAIDRAIQIAEA